MDNGIVRNHETVIYLESELKNEKKTKIRGSYVTFQGLLEDWNQIEIHHNL